MARHDCPHCDRSFPAKKALDDHVGREHPDETTPINKTALVVGGLLVVAALVVGATVLTGGGGGEADDSRFHLESAPTKGDPDAPVTLVAFESPACTSCRLFHLPRDGQPSILDRIEINYIDTGQLYYAEKYTKAGYRWEDVAASGQKCAFHMGGAEAFFDLTEHFYDRQPDVNQGNVVGFMEDWAAANGLDPEALADCAESRDHGDELNMDLNDAQRAGVLGTPTFFLIEADGFVNRLPLGEYDSFAQAIDKALEEAEQQAAEEDAQQNTTASGNQSQTTTQDR